MSAMKKILFIVFLALPGWTNAQTITKAEYFFGDDPGIGEATMLPISNGGQIDEMFTIDHDLTPGKHSMYVRLMNSEGQWGPGIRQLIFVTEAPTTAKIVAAEYFFDSDPGIGKGISLPINPRGQIDETFEVDLEGLAVGKHVFCVRVKDENGYWSSYLRETIDIAEQPETVEIAALEYFLNDDPGFGNGIPLEIYNGNELTVEPDFEEIPYGSNRLYIRALDVLGRWSLTTVASFSRIAASFTFDIEGNDVFYNNHSDDEAVRYKWLFGDGQESEQVNPRHSFEKAGAYETCLIAYRENAQDTLCLEVGIQGVQSISPTYASSTGPALLTLFGYGFEEGSSVRLVQGSREIIAHSDNFHNTYKMEAYFRFERAPEGLYDVVVTHPSKANDTLKSAFSIQSPKEHDIRLSINGPERVLINRPTKYSIAYRNNGNTMAVGVPVFITVSPDREPKILSTVSDENVLPEILEETPNSHFYMVKDSLTGDSVLLAALIIPYITPGTTGFIDLEVTSRILNPYDIEVKAGAPMFDTDALASMGLRMNSDCTFLPPCVQCMMDILSIVPVAGCAIGMFNLGCTIGNHIEGRGPKGGAGLLNFIGNAASTFLSCTPAGATAKLSLELAAQAAGTASAMGAAGASNSCGPGGCNPSSGDRKNPKTVGSLDPNTKEGLAGLTAHNYTLDEKNFHYTIYFENINTATAPASEVRIIDQLDTAVLDISTLEFTGFGFGDSVYTLSKKLSFAADIDLRPNKNIILRVTGHLDTLQGVVNWYFVSFDPATMALTDDFMEGFLPPNKSKGEGEGYVSFSIMTKPNLPHLTVIENKANIFFDLNDPIETPIWTNTIDKEEPQSGMKPILTNLSDTAFVVQWEGLDYHSGISAYDIYVAENGGEFTPWLVHTKLDSAVFYAEKGHTYAFYSKAYDWAGNKEIKTARAEVEMIPSSLTSTLNIRAEKAYLYPNPTTGKVFMTIEDGISSLDIKVYDPLGRLVKNQTYSHHDPITLDLSDCPSGVYYFHIADGNRKTVQKVIFSP